MAHYIKNLIEQGEHQQLDFKFEISDARKIAKTFSAFANTQGGKILVGVKDNGVVSGIRTDEEVYMVESAAHLFCKPLVKYRIRKWNLEGKWILEITIPESRNKPHYAKSGEGRWLAYVRVNDENFLANPVLLNVWKLKRRPGGIFIRYGPKEREILKVLPEKNGLSIKELAKLSGIRKFYLEKILVRLISVGVVEIVFTDHEAYYRQGNMYELTG